MASTGVPEDDVARSEVWVDDGCSVSFEPVDMFVGVLEVVPTEAFLQVVPRGRIVSMLISETAIARRE
jgi:hypothetical protein